MSKLSRLLVSATAMTFAGSLLVLLWGGSDAGCSAARDRPAAVAASASASPSSQAAGPAARGRTDGRFGDLRIPEGRMPHWHALDYLPVDTSSWAVQQVPCKGPQAIAAAIRDAKPKTVLQLAANCTYEYPPSAGPLVLDRSELVLRGAGPSTVLAFSHIDQTGIEMGLRGWPPNQVFGDGRRWTQGYRLGETVLQVESTRGLEVGGWVRLLADNEPDWHRNARNGYSAKLVCVGRTGRDPACASLREDQVKIDRPLNSEFHQGGQVLERVTGRYVSFTGIEKLRIFHRTPDKIEKYRPRLSIEDCHECWVVDCDFGDAGNSHISLSDSSRVAIRGNRFGSTQCTEDGERCKWNKGVVYYNDHTYDTVFENNAVVDSPSGPVLQNGGGNVVAYNYMTAKVSVECERHVFLHGQGVRSSLVEGNDVDCMMQWDSYRDGQGYYNTFYRNRLRGSPSEGAAFGTYYRGRIGGELQGSYVHRAIAVIANHANELMGGPQPKGVPMDASFDAGHRHEGTWISYNIARSGLLFDPKSDSVKHENHVAEGPPAGWKKLRFPSSFYRQGPPPWWCKESGPFPSIGAPSDRAGRYTKLPAQIRLEGGTCTRP